MIPDIRDLSEHDFLALRAQLDHQLPIEEAQRVLSRYHASDIAKLVQYFDPDERIAFLRRFHAILDAEVLNHLDESVRDQLLGGMPPQIVASLLDQLNSDDMVSIIESFDTAQREPVLQCMTQEDRIYVQTSLTYPEGSAGRLMQREIFGLPAHSTVGQALKVLAHVRIPEGTSDIFLVNRKKHLVGVLPLAHLFKAAKTALLESLAQKAVYTISVDMDEQEVANHFRQYDLLCAPVVDADNRLVGMITLDDVMDIVSETAEESILSLSGLRSSDFYEPILKTATSRLPWLLLTLGSVLMASGVVAQFADILQRKIVLAIFMPVVASMGGNAGTQVLTVTVRALALQELTSWNTFRSIVKELRVSLLNGMILGSLLGNLSYWWFGDPGVSILLGVSVVLNILWSGIMGTILPIVTYRLGKDPALSAGPVLTTLTDIFGFAVFLGLAVLTI